MWKILVVDDNSNNRQLLIESLAGKAECDSAENGEQALAAYEQALADEIPYDLILLDIAMPGMSGIDVLNRIREVEREEQFLLEAGVPIIMVTAHKDPAFEAYMKGCDDYIVKPVRPDKLLEKVEKKLKPY
jgi:two-component system, chemotaxis family, chemotaxis protein CheY